MFEQVKQEIDNTIKTNGNNEITATRLNGVLQDMMDAAAEEIENVAESVGDQVEANPTGEATTPLNKIKIGETIYKTDNPFVGEVQATDAERIQALANISNQEAGYDSSDPPAFTGKMGYVVLQPEKAGDATTTFAAQIANKPNTIFEIRDVFDISGTNDEPVEITIPSNCKIRFEGGMLTGEYCTLVGNNTLIESDSLCIKKGVVISGTWANDTIYSKWFEFVSVNDEYITVSEGGVDTQQFNPNPTNNLLCFKQVEHMANGTKGCVIEFVKGYYQAVVNAQPKGTTTIDNVEYPIWWPTGTQPNEHKVMEFGNISYLDINLNGSKFKSLVTNCPDWNFIFARNIGTVRIHDGEIEGFANQFDYPSYINKSNNITNNYEFPTLVKVNGSTKQYCYNLYVHNSEGDAFVVGSAGSIGCEEYAIENCEVSYCGRNGIVLYSSNYGTLRNNHIHNVGSDGGNGIIGSDGIMGRNPMAGIDMEFEDSIKLKPVMLWEGLNIHDCYSCAFGVGTNSTAYSFIANNLNIEGSCNTNRLKTENGKPTFNDCNFIQSYGQGRFVGRCVYNNCFFDIRSTMFFGSNTFINCTFVDNIVEIEGTSASDHTAISYDSGENMATLIDCNMTFKHKCNMYRDVFKGCNITLSTNIFQLKLLISSVTKFIDTTIVSTLGDTYNHSISSDSTGSTPYVFERCTFENIKGVSSSTLGFNILDGFIMNDCTGDIIAVMPSGTKSMIFNRHTSNKVIIAASSMSSSGIMQINNSVIGNLSKTGGYGCIIKDSRVSCGSTSLFSGQGNTVDNSIATFAPAGSDYYPKATITNSVVILNKTTLNAGSKDKLYLNNCYIDGLVSEALYQGEAINCTFKNAIPKKGTTSDRPAATNMPNNYAGFTYFDETLGYPLFLKVDVDITDPDNPMYTKSWVKADGTLLS